MRAYTGCSKKNLTILNGYNIFNIHGRWMKQKLAESWDFKILLHLYIHFSNIILSVTIAFECNGSIFQWHAAEFQQELIR